MKTSLRRRPARPPNGWRVAARSGPMSASSPSRPTDAMGESIRRIMGLAGLARKHGAALTDDACGAALEVGLPANPYGFARRWLERRPALTLRQVDPIIRQLTLYRDLIDSKTQESQE